MAKPGQTSFRRILLSRILLLSVPILLIGVYVTYKRAETSFLATAHQNLKESAVRKAERIQDAISVLSTNLVTASQSVVLQSDSRQDIQKFLDQLSKHLPSEVQCLQLANLQPDQEITNLSAGNCSRDQLISNIPVDLWPQQYQQLVLNHSYIYINGIFPKSSQDNLAETNVNKGSNSQMRLILSAPVYNREGKLSYVLSIESLLLQEEKAKPGSLTGYTVVISENGTILAHPLLEKVGTNIVNEEDARRLESLVNSAIAGNQNSLHLFSFGKNDEELLAGYTSIYSPISNPEEKDGKWVILAVQSRNNALSVLKEFSRRFLLGMTLSLITAGVLATIYIARDLARPVEKLTDYALRKQNLRSTERFPDNFHIREFNQLAEATNSMVERLKAWAEELEAAWKEAQTANQLKNEFLATTSHELRTPLNAIIGCIRLVKDGCCDNREEELDFLQRADDAAIHLLGIINDVLDIAKIETGKLSVSLEPVDLKKLLKDVIALQAVPIEYKGLQLKVFNLEKAIAVRADPAKLKQVLINIIGNATKFTEKGSITINVQVKNEQEKPKFIGKLEEESSLNTDNSGTPFSQVIVTVQDTGIGIEPSQQHKLFRPFVMVDGTTTRKFGGTGLGLAISKKLMELMGGTISLFSEGEGKGTTVEITLPTIDNSLLLSEELRTEDWEKEVGSQS